MGIAVSVACLEAGKQVWLRMDVDEGATVADAVQKANLPKAVPGFVLEGHNFGIFGRLVTPETALKAGDRIEVYRPISGA